MRKRKRMPFAVEIDGDLQDECPVPEEVYLEKVQRSALRQKITGLDKEYWKVLALHYLQQLSYKEIGSKLSLSVDAVRMRLSYARKKLRDHFNRTENTIRMELPL